MIIKFFVEGEPMPFPKKAVNRRTGMIYSVDKGGFKRGWIQNITLTAKGYMNEHNLSMNDEDTPVFLICRFYKTMPDSIHKKTKVTTLMKYPYRKPDLDNYGYSVANALSGVCYWDDSRIVSIYEEKRWADDEHKAGVEVYVLDVKEGKEIFKGFYKRLEGL